MLNFVIFLFLIPCKATLGLVDLGIPTGLISGYLNESVVSALASSFLEPGFAELLLYIDIVRLTRWRSWDESEESASIFILRWGYICFI